ncbi:MAG TPA: hypothetical protein PKO09_01485 [Anaerolineae bacterium]|nr:hypothetical protein [Anaerolineae bacterium]
MNEGSQRELRLKEYKADLVERVSNPIHKRIIEAYQLSNPVESMEDELGEILLEVLHDEN